VAKAKAAKAPVATSRRTSDQRSVGLRKGFRSGLEKTVARQLEDAGLAAAVAHYETLKVKYERPATSHTYTPDFPLPNGIIVETKGLFDAEDRKKHLLVQAQHPELDIRFVFSNSRAKLYKGSPTTYAAWCEKNGFKYADKLIPRAWLQEDPKE
jgi:hypothetical protein